jgi:hypothetical protein
MKLEQLLRTTAIIEHRSIVTLTAVMTRDYCGRVDVEIAVVPASKTRK